SVALLLLSPMVPLMFMGEEWGSEQPFLYFTSHNEALAQAAGQVAGGFAGEVGVVALVLAGEQHVQHVVA
ncbi:hypothetical protein R0G64_32670, partial [Pseudomonas otitidis]